VPGRPRVVLVDDHPGFAKALGRVLSFECDVVGVLADGREAVDAVARMQPAVVVVDVYLAGVNGIDVCRAITTANPKTKVLMVTGVTDDAIRDEALAAGASGFFVKSAADDLIAAIKRAWAQ
jgi:DNA-binding NarL/FixJ family response regulator